MATFQVYHHNVIRDFQTLDAAKAYFVVTDAAVLVMKTWHHGAAVDGSLTSAEILESKVPLAVLT